MKMTLSNSLKVLSIWFFAIISVMAIDVVGNDKITLYDTDGASTAILGGVATGKNITIANPYASGNRTVWGGTINGTLDGTATKFYCIDINNTLKSGNSNPYTDDAVTPSTITYVLNNYYPFNSSRLDAIGNNEEAAAVQAVIWSYSDGVNLSSITDAAVKNRALAIRADADANSGTIVPIQTVMITPNTANLPYGVNGSFVVYVYDLNGNPVQNVTVNLATTSGTLSSSSVVTGVGGVTPSFTLTRTTSDAATLTAVASAVLPQGTRFIHVSTPNESQKLVLATPTMAQKQAQATITWFPLSDLSLTKSVSDSSPDDGDVITFTLTVTNNGPGSATGIEVTDVLPAGLNYNSYTSTQGTFSNTTGLWVVGSLASGASASLTISATVDLQSLSTTAFTLGAAASFNLFVFEDVVKPSSDVEGKMAVGRDATLGSFSVGDKLTNSNGTVDVLVVGRNLHYTSGRIYNGNAVYGNATNLPSYAVSIEEGSLRKADVIDFAAAKVALTGISTSLSTYPVNGSATFQWGGYELVGTNPYTNVFKLYGDTLSLANNVAITVPNGSVVIINVQGNNIDWNGGLTVSGTSIENVIYNFYEATNVTISGIDVRGSVLAPHAHVNFPAGVINGQLICNSHSGAGQVNNVMFQGNIPPNPNIVNIAEITACDQPDPNSTPGNGVTTENDYASASIVVNTGGTTGTTTNWIAAGNFALNEVILSITNDVNGDLLVGTLGGNIYRTADNGVTFTEINPTMNVGWIWSLTVSTTGKIYAGTEQGVFSSTNGGTTWVASTLSGKDVRAIAKDASGNLYAGTWGHGIYRSADAGATWTAINTGLTFTAVHALAIDAAGSVYAGTFGGGVYKTTNAGAQWNQLPVGYDFVWSLGITNDQTIIAGTYGNGIYRSTDAGASWSISNNGVTAKFIYTIAVDNANTVYIGAWAAGIYTSSNGGGTWKPIGMNGIGISSLFVNPANGALLATSENGGVYQFSGALSNEGDREVPTQFSLAQNYPNPFNPSTMIEFSLPIAQNVTVSVYDVLGREVATLVDGMMDAGVHNVAFDASELSSGVYIYNIRTQGFSASKKMLLTK